MSARVLVVEDNETNLDLMVYLLRAYGHETLCARDGDEGLAALVAERPDLALVDVQMPRRDGVSLARAARDDARIARIPLVAITAMAMVGDRERFLSAGFDGYLAKPIDPQSFLAEIERFLPPALRRQKVR